MAIKNLNISESWDAVYQAFDKVNFVSFDYEAVKESLTQYMKMYYSEVFNDYIETSELIAIIDAFAVIAEQLAYRIDMSTHENFISTAERKQNILKLAKLISYNASRNLPARGLVKLSSVSTSESVLDSQGNDLANRTIVWNDSNNTLWKEQFFLVMNRLLTNKFGQPSKSFQVGDVAFQLYTFNSSDNSFGNGVYGYDVATSSETIHMEIVSSDIDGDGVFETFPDKNNKMNVVYANDGLGDGSDMTGFLMYTKQGNLVKLDLTFENPIPNDIIDINLPNVNNVDVWLSKVDNNGNTLEKWAPVEAINTQNIFFNTDKNRKKYEVETLERDQIRLIFGDNDFAEIPVGNFNLWVRQSLNSNIAIQKNKVINQPFGFSYLSGYDVLETSNFTFGLVSTLQNGSSSEDIEHIRRTAPSTYYSQNRMVNGQDYNTLLLRDPSILKLKAVNRTFAGQPKYIEWNDSSGAYQNVKIFGDDLRLYYDMSVDLKISTLSSRTLITDAIEPLLKDSGILNTLTFMTSSKTTAPKNFSDVISNPRYQFIESATRVIGDLSINPLQDPLLEKTKIQGVLDRHYYGEPLNYVTIGNSIYADVTGDADGKIYDDSTATINNGVIGSPSNLQPISDQPIFGIGFSNDVGMIGNGTIGSITSEFGAPNETWTIELINEEAGAGTFTVIGSVSGYIGTAIVGEVFDHDLLTFLISLAVTPVDFVTGDAFVLDVVANVATLRTFTFNSVVYNGPNLDGYWYIINGTSLKRNSTNTDYDYTYDPSSIASTTGNASWVFLIKRIDDSANFGQTKEWEIYSRNLKIVVESDTTKFWYNSDSYIIDPASKNKVRDRLSVLKSNLNKVQNRAIGKNVDYDVIDSIKYDNGLVNFNALEVLPTDASNAIISGDGIPDNSMAFPQFVNVSGANIDYVYFKKSIGDDIAIPVQATPAIKRDFISGGIDTGLPVSNSGNFIRKIGRDNLDFLWQHFSPNSNLIDPSTSNIIDMFVLTSGYYSNVMAYITGGTTYSPVPPSPLELRNSYSSLLSSKMISDTVVMHSGKIKLLFGDLADGQLRAKFRVIRAQSATLTDDQIKAEIVNVINTFFNIQNWNFGDTFYATELIALIHQRLPIDIASIVLVPLFVNNSFGSLFVIETGEDEILQSCAKITDVEIVSNYTPNILRQNI